MEHLAAVLIAFILDIHDGTGLNQTVVKRYDDPQECQTDAVAHQITQPIDADRVYVYSCLVSVGDELPHKAQYDTGGPSKIR